MNIDYNQGKWGELSLKYLVIETETYIVFVDNDLDIDWITSDDYNISKNENLVKHNNILTQIALLECKPNGYLSEKITLDFKRLLGESLARSFAGEYKTAFNTLAHAEIYLENRGKELSRQWYLSNAGFVSSIVLIIGIIAWLFKDFIITYVGTTFFILYLSTVTGALGALLSIIMRMGKENFDIHAGKRLHVLESSYRIFAGMLSALLVSMAIYSELVLSILSKINNTDIAIIFIGFIAGMSERFAPSILAKIEGKK